MPELAPLVLVNAVGLTSRLLDHAPRIKAASASGWVRPLREDLPAVTCTAQASLLTGVAPNVHGIVANGWLYRETGEVRFWQQSNALIQAETVYAKARRIARKAGRSFRWRSSSGGSIRAPTSTSASRPNPTTAPTATRPSGSRALLMVLPKTLRSSLAGSPFKASGGPLRVCPAPSGSHRAPALLLERERPDLSLVYLPHLDYEPQRQGPSKVDMPKLVGDLDKACEPLLDAAKRVGARVWFVSEYGHCDVSRPVHLNRVLRKSGLLRARPGPFGESLDVFLSRAFAVCDHQLAHVYVKDSADVKRVSDLIAAEPGVGKVYSGDARSELALNHPRSGEIVALSTPDAWFAYPYWLDDRQAPDFARTVDIHRKPGFDPCELFFDPKLRWPQGRAGLRLLQKKLGFRTLFDVIPLDASIVRGSHGLRAGEVDDKPLLIGDGPAPAGAGILETTRVFETVLQALFEGFDLPLSGLAEVG